MLETYSATTPHGPDTDTFYGASRAKLKVGRLPRQRATGF